MTVIAMPHCGMAANSTSGGEVVEREVLSRIGTYGIDAHVLRPVCRGLRWWNSPLLFAAPLRNCLMRHTPALIRAHSLRYTGLAALVARRVTGVKVAAHFHHLEQDRLAWLDRFVLRQADQIITDSAFSQRQVAYLGVKAEIVPLGVDHERFRPSPMPSGRVVLLLGGTKRRKNAAFVRALWPEVVRWVPDARLVEAGQGTRLSDQAMTALYHRARVVAFPSLLEGFGLPVLEAMACGRPVVVSNCGALPEFNATTRYLQPDLWVEALVHLLTDDRHWQDCVEDGRWVAAGYSWDATAKALAEAWHRCAD